MNHVCKQSISPVRFPRAPPLPSVLPAPKIPVCPPTLSSVSRPARSKEADAVLPRRLSDHETREQMRILAGREIAGVSKSNDFVARVKPTSRGVTTRPKDPGEKDDLTAVKTDSAQKLDRELSRVSSEALSGQAERRRNAESILQPPKPTGRWRNGATETRRNPQDQDSRDQESKRTNY